MNKRGVMAGCAAAALAGFVAVGPAAADQFEDNDTCTAGAPVGNGLYTGLDVSEFDADWYTIEVPFGSQLYAEIEHAWFDGDIDISLYDECDEGFIRTSWTAGNFETVIYTNNGFDTTVHLHVFFADFITTSNTYTLFIDGALDAGPACACDLDGTGGVDVFDLLAYLDLWFGADPAADIDGAGGVDVFDLLAFLDCWFPASAGSPC